MGVPWGKISDSAACRAEVGGIFRGMGSLGRTIPARYCRRMCLACGFDGRAIQPGHAGPVRRCPRCLADFSTRPPRSYSELEGLDAEEESAEGRAGARGVGTTIGFRAASSSGHRATARPGPGAGAARRRGLLGSMRPIGVLLGALCVVVMAAALIGIGVWLPAQF